MRRAAAADRTTIAAIVAVCGLTLLLGYVDKARCAGAPFDADGRSLIFDRIKDSQVCYSDIQYLWLGRGIDQHLFPYVDGGITTTGTLTGGSVEYPVLSGVLMWLGAVGAHDDATFLLHSALLLAPFALLTAWLLGRLAGRAALLWAAGPPLVLYAFHNWELPVVVTTVAAVYVVAAQDRWSLRTRGVLAAVLLGIGFCLKLYPGMFVLPLAAFVFTGGIEGRELPRQLTGRFDPRGAAAVIAAAALTIASINLPFALAGYSGWRASFTFQQQREADITSNSIWYWGMRRLFGSDAASEAAFQHTVSLASPALIFAAFAGALWLGWRRHAATGSYPWVQVSAAMLCGFLLFHKVHSPQYTLWILPFFVLLAVPWRIVAAFFVADLALGLGVFRYFHELVTGGRTELLRSVVEFGVWGQASLLLVSYFVFLWSEPRAPASASPPVATEREIATTVRLR